MIEDIEKYRGEWIDIFLVDGRKLTGKIDSIRLDHVNFFVPGYVVGGERTDYFYVNVSKIERIEPARFVFI